jgi:glucokinase
MSTRSLVVALDVGGTNTRARIATATGGGEPRILVPDITTRASSARELRAFLLQVVRTAEHEGAIAAAVVDVAGPVTGDRSRITNWPSTDSSISVADLERAGLPHGRTRLVNDATAGAWGALARVDRGEGTPQAEALTSHHGGQGLGVGNLVYVAPGTGLSSAFIVRHGLGPVGASVVACEFENTRIPRFEGEIGAAVETISRSLGRAPDWEDLVSGRGLVRIYEALDTRAGITASDARAIAESARAGSDERARTASDVFYRTLGLFAQTLALSCLPCAAVVIGGASTERNLDVLREAGLAETFATHHRFSELLSAIPLYAVGGQVNLEGAVRLALQAS